MRPSLPADHPRDRQFLGTTIVVELTATVVELTDILAAYRRRGRRRARGAGREPWCLIP
jgi:hypothetical protein